MEWSQAELKDLQLLMPDSVRVREDGRLFATVDKEQVRYLLNAYPTMDGNTSPRATEEDASLTLRYPTMK